MKVTFNLGAISFTGVKAQRVISEEVTTKADGFVGTERVIAPGSNVEFSMGESSCSFEAEPGELAAIYKEIAPMVSDLVKTLAVLK